MRLYELPEAIRDLVDRAVDPETGEIDEALEAELDALHEAFEAKAEYIALLSREAKAEAAAWKLEEDRLAKNRRSAENRAKRLTNYLHACLIQAGLPKLETARAKIRIQKNGRPSILWTLDPDKIPEAFRRVTVDVDGQAVYDEWKGGGELPEGFQVELGSHLRVT